MISWIAIFATCFTLDWFWVFYTKAVAVHAVGKATWWSAVIMLVTGFNITEMASNWHLVIPAAAGCALGTYAALKTYNEDVDA